MERILEVLQREAIYLLYYFDIQFRQIFWYWVLGIVLGSLISVFLKGKLSELCQRAGRRLSGPAGWFVASALGVASPLCMYGTIPIAASFSQKGIKDDFLAAFMVSSVLLNPQLIVYSAALGTELLAVRAVSCFLCGACAGFLIWVFYCKRRPALRLAPAGGAATVPTAGLPGAAGFVPPEGEKKFFNFDSMGEAKNRDTDPNLALRLLKNIWRNVKATGPMFLLGIALSALFQRYVPAEAFAALFGERNEGFGVLLAATIGVPLYVCGGGTIPLMIQWLADGMTAGAAASFMLTGPATKITNLGALKIVLGAKSFALYLGYIIVFSLLTGLVVNLFL